MAKAPNISDVIFKVSASFNNTRIVATTVHGDVLAWATAGSSGFRGSRKSTPFAGTSAADKVIKQLVEVYNAKEAVVHVEGPGPGREAIREIASKFKVKAIYDTTPLPHNGCRKRKRRRV